MRVPFLDLKAQHRAIAKELRRALLRVLDSGSFILGPEGRLFEREFSRLLGARVLGVSSGTSALELSLKALGLGPEDEVVLPAFTFIATATAVSAAGARPVLADVDPSSLTLGANQAEAALTPRTRALLPVHLYGQPADMDPLLALARKKGLRVLEDCAQAHLALYKGRPTGSLGDMPAFSFYPTKNLGALGDAGAVATRHKGLALACEELRNAGRAPGAHYDHVRIGHNCRLDELQAAVLRVKLRHLARWTARRRRIAGHYHRELSDLPLALPSLGSDGTRPSFHLYVIRLQAREALARHLQKAGIGTGVYYPRPVHLQPAYRGLGLGAGSLPHAEEASRRVLALPLYPELTDGQVERVCRAVRRFFR